MLKIKTVFMFAMMLISFSVFSATVTTAPTKISEINSYSNFPDGDTLVSVDSPISECPGGFWLKMDDIGFQKNMSMLLSAFHAQSNIVFFAESTSTWSYSPLLYCHISQIKLVR